MQVWKFWGARQSPSASASPQTPPSQPESSANDNAINFTPKMDVPAQKVAHRVHFSNVTANVTAWPSGGGILVKNADAVDLQRLGVSRFEPTPRSEPFDPVKEDTWAAKLQQIAPKWYRDHKDWLWADLGGRPLTQKEIEQVYIAWPAKGGVWVLRFSDGQQADGFGCYHMCFDMEERCDVLEKFGGQYYAQPSDCYELSQAYIDDFRKQRDELGGYNEDNLCWYG